MTTLASLETVSFSGVCEIPPDEFEQITKEAREVRPGGPTRLEAFSRRQEMVEEGDASPIFQEEGEEQ